MHNTMRHLTTVVRILLHSTRWNLIDVDRVLRHGSRRHLINIGRILHGLSLHLLITIILRDHIRMLVVVLITILKLWLYHLRWNHLRRWSISLSLLLLTRFSWVGDRGGLLLITPTNFVVSFQTVKNYSTAKDNYHSRNHDIGDPAGYADVLW